MKKAVLAAFLLAILTGCDWTGGFMTDAPMNRPIGTCLETRLACDLPEKPKPGSQQTQPQALPQPQPEPQTLSLPPDPQSQYQP